MTFINQKSNILVTGGAGFIGSSFILYLLAKSDFHGNIINIDKLTYAANLNNLKGIENHLRYKFYKEDIQNKAQIEKICLNHKIDLIIHFAAESHVDNSIQDPMPFVMSNVLGTVNLLEIVKKYPSIHFHHISTDEVFGDLSFKGSFKEDNAYKPNSPYAASKASSDHFVRAYSKTYQLSTTISNSCNNYGPRQHKEKLIPKIIESLIRKKSIPIYGNGENHREWIFVEDHSRALFTILTHGKKGKSYNVGSNIEMSNLQMTKLIIEKYCEITNELTQDYLKLINFVPDRKGHDFRYFLDITKLNKLGFKIKFSIDKGLNETIKSIINNQNLVTI
jgi:dTDP-glucose 4,6-dehydratase